MSLDIKYRPRNYADVLGQDTTIAILKRFVSTGRGFQQSYLFCGGFGSGKTTIGRILARALLCDSPVEGAPCDQCVSCLTLLKDGSSADFTEVDAATNSGKAEITKIKEDIQYSSFSGRQRLYLFDEAHQLSKDALDALLKPLEDPLPGTDNKRLVCIFCTTEPEKMRATVLSRCAPAFVVAPQTPEAIAQRMAFICDAEGIQYEQEALQLIAEITECHIRDALKALEGISLLGAVDKANVRAYLHLDLNTVYLDILSLLGSDLERVLALARDALAKASPGVCYEKLADGAMSAFQNALGIKGATHWDRDRLAGLSTKGDLLLTYVDRFSSRPKHPTSAMLLCDLAVLHHGGVPAPVAGNVVQRLASGPPLVEAGQVSKDVVSTSNSAAPPAAGTSSFVQQKPIVAGVLKSDVPKPDVQGTMRNPLTDDPSSPMFVNPKAVAKQDQDKAQPRYILNSEQFCNYLAMAFV
jgi:DNA polymerase III subunit gamma/tau